jgi:tyrosine decarboxylase
MLMFLCCCQVRDWSGTSNGGDGGWSMRPMDAEQLRECGHRMVDFIADYYKSIETFPVLSQVQARSLLTLLQICNTNLLTC